MKDREIEKLKKSNNQLILDNQRLNKNFRTLQTQINRLETLIINMNRKG